MTAAAANRPIPRKGETTVFLPSIQRWPVEAATTLLGGVMVGPDASNNLIDAGTAGCQYIAGITRQQYPNVSTSPFSNPPAGSAGSIIAEVMIGVFPFFQTGTTTITNAHIGFPCYAADNQTVSLAASAGPFAGYVYGIDTNPQTLGQVLVLFASPLANSKGGEIVHLIVDVPLATIQALTSGTPANIGSPLPVGAQVLAYDINVLQVVAGGTIASAAVTVQNTGETAGALIASTSVFTGAAIAPKTAVGSNPQPQRGGQQLQQTLTVGGDTPNHATTGHYQIDIFYAITG